MRDSLSAKPSVILPALALAAGSFLFGQSFQPDTLAAAPVDSLDLDSDGLVDVQEKILATSLEHVDSDQDGFTDLEEFSRGTDPLLDLDFPASNTPSLAMTGRVVDDVFKAVTALYVPHESMVPHSTIDFGIQYAGMLIPINPMLLFVGAQLTTVDVGTTGKIYLLETPVPESVVLALGNVGLYATYSTPGATSVEHAATLNLFVVNGIIAQVVSTPTGSSYRPLTEGPDLPATWSPAQVCVQTLETVGVIGPILQQEVIDASCQQVSADSYCPPDCVNLVGSTHDVVDPIGLIGG